ncbi:hypothetical protein FOZ60_014861 [Perkinsus olseni]|uniref:RNase H type-1 domain-containing protein n=1 Tax=Perkinsus olseni TaxID=32597 RepID=A0A7J6N6Z3_PEROL|nr:hypothetical protein FOZ60_014861 [Perkinsus olseni]
MLAIERALTHLARMQGVEKVTLFSDSLVCLQMLRARRALERDAWPREDPHISDILYQLGDKVRLAWIPSHTGSIAPSDLVDKRAKDARHHGVSVSCPAPRAHTASLLKRASERECAARVRQLNERLRALCGSQRQRRIVQDHIAAGPKLAGLVIGHARHYRAYMHRIGRASDPYRQKCQLREAETPRHRAIRCPGVARPQWVHPNGTLGQFSISKKRIKALERLLSVGVTIPQVA